jgi:23S rRNA pseudouridine955/2504/2580 synthase/23S rRNA pseudouridine1911/1915/1917 synthase
MAKKSYEIIYEDEHLLIANKFSGLLTIPDRFRPDIPNLYQELKKIYTNIYIVHRLDKGTSGLICFAKTKETHKLMSQQFEARKPEKHYYALVKGTPINPKGVIEAGLSPNTNGTMRIDLKRGKPSTTNYEVKESFASYALVDVQIMTGRMHQIRVHLKHLGHPLAVDVAYAQKRSLFLSEIKRKKFNLKKDTQENPLLSRVPLHAYSLSFEHPITQAKVAVECPLPKDMRAALNQLRKWNKA